MQDETNVGHEFVPPEATAAPPPAPEQESRGLRIPCPDCGQMCLPAGLAIHRYRAHSIAGARHTRKIVSSNAERLHQGRGRRRRMKYTSKEQARIARNEQARLKYARLKRGTGTVEAATQDAPYVQRQPSGLCFCPGCGTDLRPFNAAAGLAHRLQNGK